MTQTFSPISDRATIRINGVERRLVRYTGQVIERKEPVKAATVRFTPKVTPKEPKVRKERNGSNNMIAVICDGLPFPSMKHAADYLGIPCHFVSEILNRVGNSNGKYKGHILSFADENRKPKLTRRYKLKGTKGGFAMRKVEYDGKPFESQAALAKYLSISGAHICTILKKGNGEAMYSGKKIKLLK